MVQRRIRRVALTGGIATGKSHVRARFGTLGVPTIDADVLAREAVARGSAGLAEVVRRFGSAIVDADGSLNRKKLGTIVFGNTAARQDLEAIIHPYVREMTDKWYASLDSSRYPFAIADIPLLFEGERERDFDTVVVTACEPAAQLQRLIQRDALSEQEEIGRAHV